MLTHICGNNFKSIANWVFKETKPTNNGIVFCKTDFINECFDTIRTRPGPFVLITHNSDYGIDDNLADKIPDNVKHLFGQNASTNNPRVTGIPIGLANPEYDHGNFSIIANIRRSHMSKKDKVFACFNARTHPSRPNVLRTLQQMDFVDVFCNLPFEQHSKKVSEYQFMASPRGNGIDCCRVWEALYLKTIPIVQKSIAMKHFHDLPIIFVDDFQTINMDLLNTQLSIIRRSELNMAKLSIEYWKRQMHDKLL